MVVISEELLPHSLRIIRFWNAGFRIRIAEFEIMEGYSNGTRLIYESQKWEVLVKDYCHQGRKESLDTRFE